MSDPAKTMYWQEQDLDTLSLSQLEEGRNDLLLAAQEIDAQMGDRNRRRDNVKLTGIEYALWRTKALFAKAHIEHTYRKYKAKIKEIQNGRRNESRESSNNPGAVLADGSSLVEREGG